MERRKLLFLTIQQIAILVFFSLTTLMFFLSISQGNEGVTFKFLGGGDDGYFYWEQANNVANGNPWVRTSIYPLILGFLMRVFGIESVFFIRILNYIGLLLLISFSMKLIVIQFQDNKISRNYIYNSKTLLLICYMFYASLQMNVSISILRDIWIYTIYALATLLSVNLIFKKKGKLFYFIATGSSIWLLGEFRGYAMLSFLLSVGIYFFYAKIKKPKKILIFGLITFIIYFTFFKEFNIFNMSLQKALNYRMSSLEQYSGGSQMMISLEQSNFILFFINYIHSYIGNLIGPLPWHISGISTLFVFLVETLPMIFILKFLWKRKKLLTKIQKYILLHGFVWASLIGFTNDNVGTASRLRPITWILILIVFVVVYFKVKYLNDIREKR